MLVLNRFFSAATNISIKELEKKHKNTASNQNRFTILMEGLRERNEPFLFFYC